jgi:hypothetical protein
MHRSTRRSRRTALSVAALAALVVAGPLAAQQGPAPQLAQSSRASVSAIFSGRVIGGRWLPSAAGVAGPAEIRIEYGQPHARGRRIFGVVVPWDSVWRTGANLATTLTTDVDVMIGDALVPRGTYTLFTIPSRAGSTLIVSRQTGQWGTDYDPRHDLARIDLRMRTLREPVESLTWYLVPSNDRSPRGVLRIVWGDVELSTDWRVR